ncbi:hypothetical protein TN53_08285 [Streptomyces sp. WM6386]|nr:hypothetical protein TN53_08285 [Streptomyces sp. WM6386]
MIVADRGVRRRGEPRRHGDQQDGHEGGHRGAHDAMHRFPAAGQRRATRGEERDQQDAGRPDQAPEQRRHRVHREADRRLRVDEVADLVREQSTDVPDIAESRDLQTPAPSAAAGQVVEAERAAVDRDDVVTRPGQPAQRGHEQRDHRTRAREEFGRCDDNSGRP